MLAAGPVLAGRRLLGLVAEAELDLPATGATGMLARRAHGAGVDLADLLAADAELRGWIDEHAPGLGSAPGSGAAGGTGLVVLAAGGELVSPTQYCYRLAGAERAVRAADLVVTGCTELSALDHGGEVVAAVSGWAGDAERPCIAFSTGTPLTRRELRTFGLEAAHQVPVPATAEGLTAVAARIAGGWFPARPRRDVH
jgi:glycerate kinase